MNLITHLLIYYVLLSILLYGSLAYSPRMWLHRMPPEVVEKVPLKTPTEKRLLLKSIKEQFPEMKKDELENLLLDLKRIPMLFKRLITETQVNLEVYERFKKIEKGKRKSKRVGKDYKLKLDTVVGISDGQTRRKQTT